VAQECDATGDDSSNAAGIIINKYDLLQHLSLIIYAPLPSLTINYSLFTTDHSIVNNPLKI
jgi:hypothetical protein